MSATPVFSVCVTVLVIAVIIVAKLYERMVSRQLKEIADLRRLLIVERNAILVVQLHKAVFGTYSEPSQVPPNQKSELYKAVKALEEALK